MRRVLWLAKGLGPGGMERLLVNHAALGDRGRFEYRAGYLVERPNSLIGSLEALGVACTRFGGDPGRDPRWAGELRKFVRGHHIDLVHMHSPLVAAVARPVLRTMRPRPALVYTEHNSWDSYSAPTRFANAITYPLDDAQIAVSSAAACSVARWLRRRVEVLIHGIDVEAVAGRRSQRAAKRSELGVGPDVTVIVTVANLRREKAYDVLLGAAAEVTTTRRNVLFVSIGQGPLAAELEQRSRRLGLQNRFRFLGYRNDVYDLMAAADIFCLASRHEGLPVALMEAYALGLPVVATRVGGLPEVVEDGRAGLLVEPEDAGALAYALGALVDDPERRSQLGRRAADLAARFDARLAVRRLEAVYEEVSR